MSEPSSNTPLSDNNDFQANDDDGAATMEIDSYSLLAKLDKLTEQTNNDLQEHEHVLQSVLNYVNTVFESSNYSYWKRTAFLVGLLSYSNKTFLVPCLIKTDYPRALLKWLSSISK
jgi:hypothetical protein